MPDVPKPDMDWPTHYSEATGVYTIIDGPQVGEMFLLKDGVRHYAIGDHRGIQGFKPDMGLETRFAFGHTVRFEPEQAHDIEIRSAKINGIETVLAPYTIKAHPARILRHDTLDNRGKA